MLCKDISSKMSESKRWLKLLSLQSDDSKFSSIEHWKGIERMSPFACTQKMKSNFEKGWFKSIELLLLLPLLLLLFFVFQLFTLSESHRNEMNRNGSIEQSDAYYDIVWEERRSPNEISSHLPRAICDLFGKIGHDFSLLFERDDVAFVITFFLLLPWMGFMQINTTDGQLCLISILCGKSTIPCQHYTNHRYWYTAIFIELS